MVHSIFPEIDQGRTKIKVEDVKFISVCKESLDAAQKNPNRFSLLPMERDITGKVKPGVSGDQYL